MKIALCRIPMSERGARTGGVKELGASWAQFGDTVLVFGDVSRWSAVRATADRGGLHLDEYPRDVSRDRLYLVIQIGRLFQQEHPDVPVILDRGRFLVVEMTGEAARRAGKKKEPCYTVRPLEPDSVIFDIRARPAGRQTREAWVDALVNAATEAQVQSTLTHLTSYATRHSLSTEYSDAAAWAQSQLDGIGYTTSTDTVTIGGSTTRSVVADRAGSATGTRDLVLVTAHLDSINTAGSTAAAPGADDNASGSAGLLEMARVFQSHAANHDLRLVLFGGEEQGVHGSSQYVAGLSAADKGRLCAVVNMDMIGRLNTTSPTVLLEGATVSQTVIDDLADAAGTYTGLTVQTSLSPYGGDHVPFINANLPAVLTIEGADGANTDIHTANDTLATIDYSLAMDIIRMNIAYTAGKLGQKRGGIMPGDLKLDKWEYEFIHDKWKDFFIYFRASGRYKYNGGVASRAARPSGGLIFNTDIDPIYKLDKPTFIEELAWSDKLEWYFKLRFTLHIDIDGTDPLNVVSGTVQRGFLLYGASPPHFIGRVTSNSAIGSVRNLVVEDFSFTWPMSSRIIDRLEIEVPRYAFLKSTAEVTFISTATGDRYGPYSVVRESIYFHDVEIEMDCEDGSVNPEPYNTHTHPDRPSDLVEEDLTFEKAFAKAGIYISRSGSNNVINTSDAGTDNRWTYEEMHQAMETHWSAFANTPQWKLWVFLAELATSDGLGGVMFDGDINEPGGVDRQGTAVFTCSPFFHTVDGDYIKANPPEAEAVRRELFFNLIHESGHAFNLFHSFQKTFDTPWTAPSWMPVTSDDNALSWMNYPERPSSGLNASWFYDRFYFRFDDNELLFLRHAPDSYVQMGNSDWGVNHGRVARSSLDKRLALVVRSLKPTVELGEPVFLELKLKNISGEPVMAHDNLDPADGFVELAVTTPAGQRIPFMPVMHTRTMTARNVLGPNESRYQRVNLTMGKFGFAFKEPGPYRIEASYRNLDGSTAAAVMQLWVSPPANYDDRRIISTLYDARVGRAIYFGDARLMDDVNDKLDWVCKHLDKKHPARYYLTAVQHQSKAHPFKTLPAGARKLKMLKAEPDIVARELGAVMKDPEPMANSIGHIMYRQLVDTYTDAAVATKSKADARKAQETMLAMFKKRKVVADVVKSVEGRVKKLK